MNNIYNINIIKPNPKLIKSSPKYIYIYII